jgi:dynein heavy chain
VSTAFLKEIPDTSPEVKEGLAQMCCKIHLSVEQASSDFWDSLRRRVYTTPKSYLDLISLYIKLLGEYREIFNTNKRRLANGVNKLNSTNQNIAELNEKLTVMVPILEQKNKDLAAALIIVNKDKAVANEQEAKVSAEAAIVDKNAAAAQQIADEAEAVLAAAKPELEGAQKAVQSLEKNAIVEIKNFAKPPAGVVTVMECVMILLGEATKWDDIKKVLGNTNQFMDRLKFYKVEETSEKVWKKARDKYISKDDFKPDDVRKISVAAAALCLWARSCSSYAIVTKKVAPMKEKYATAMGELTAAKAELKEKLDLVQVVKDKVAKLEADCQKMQDEKEELENNMETSKARMLRAEKLVVLLADEGVRWKETVETISD